MKSNAFRLFFIQFLLTVLVCFLVAKDSPHQQVALVAFGSLISGLQIGLLYFLWWRIFLKKKIAPSVIAVVIKYALLGFFFWYLSPLNLNQIKALTAGIMTNPIAIILFVVMRKFENKNA
jgi:hypothetical protein